jgi:hypothetical protein
MDKRVMQEMCLGLTEECWRVATAAPQQEKYKKPLPQQVLATLAAPP